MRTTIPTIALRSSAIFLCGWLAVSGLFLSSNDARTQEKPAKRLYSSKVINKKTGRLRIRCTEEQILRHKQVRDYLPAVLHKALLDVEQKQVAAMANLLEYVKAAEEGGLVQHRYVIAAELELLKSRRQVLRRAKEYGDVLDQFKSCAGIPLSTPVVLDDAPLRPVLKHLRDYEQAYTLADDISAKCERAAHMEKIENFRKKLEKLVRTHRLFKGTTAQKDILRR